MRLSDAIEPADFFRLCVAILAEKSHRVANQIIVAPKKTFSHSEPGSVFSVIIVVIYNLYLAGETQF